MPTKKKTKTISAKSDTKIKSRLVKKLDKAWSEAVKRKAGYKCEVCGSTVNLNSHHIVGRRNRRVRWEIKNGVCLCVKHHKFGIESAHEDPLWFREWLEDKRWEDYRDLYIIKNEIKKWTVEDMEKKLKTLEDGI